MRKIWTTIYKIFWKLIASIILTVVSIVLYIPMVIFIAIQANRTGIGFIEMMKMQTRLPEMLIFLWEN